MQTYFVTFRCAQYTIQLHFITITAMILIFIYHYIKLTSKKTEKSVLPFDTLRAFSLTKHQKP